MADVTTGLETIGTCETAKSGPDKPVISPLVLDVIRPYGLWTGPDETEAAAAELAWRLLREAAAAAAAEELGAAATTGAIATIGETEMGDIAIGTAASNPLEGPEDEAAAAAAAA